MYLNWKEKTITDFSDTNINSLYNEGYVFTRLGKGEMQQTRSLRIDLSKFELSSENRRVLKKIEGLDLNITSLPFQNYHWSIGKMAKDFYTAKFGDGTFTANKIKEILTDKRKSNFNTLFAYSFPPNTVGYTICYATDKLLHYSYPFYNLSPNTYNPSTSLRTSLIPNLGMGMMLMGIMAAKENNKKYIYLGSAQRPTDVYKLQFAGLEWFDRIKWSDDLEELKDIIKN